MKTVSATLSSGRAFYCILKYVHPKSQSYLKLNVTLTCREWRICYVVRLLSTGAKLAYFHWGGC